MTQLLVERIVNFIQSKAKKGVIVGVSGGLDSSFVLALLFLVRQKISLEILAYFIPSKNSTKESLELAKECCNNLSIRFERTYSIDDELKQFSSFLLSGKVNSVKDIVYENFQARSRMKILMAFSNHYDYLLVSTSNLSELILGYFSLYGDSVGAFSPLCFLYKTYVKSLAKDFNFIQKMNNEKEFIPEEIVRRLPSAELRKGQTDIQDLGTNYENLDRVLSFINGRVNFNSRDLFSIEDKFKKTIGSEKLNKKFSDIATDLLHIILSRIKKNIFKVNYWPTSLFLPSEEIYFLSSKEFL